MPTPAPQPIIVEVPTGVEVPAVEAPTGLEVDIRIASGAGTVDPPPAYTTMTRTQVVIRARPDPGYSFDYYLVDGKKPFFKPDMKLTVSDKHVVEVYFSPGLRKTRLIIPKLLYQVRRVVK